MLAAPLAGHHHDKLQHASRQLRAASAAAESVVLDIADETPLARLGRTLEPVDNIVVTAGAQAPDAAFTTLGLPSVKQAFDTKFWGNLAVARYLAGNIRTGGTITLASGFLARRAVPGELVKNNHECRPGSGSENTDKRVLFVIDYPFVAVSVARY